jgi:hypothetical protein
MPDRVRIITIDMQPNRLITNFIPPITASKTLEATSNALPILEILHHRGNTAVSGVAYEIGSPDVLEERLESMQAELEANTGYELRAGIPKLVAEAMR